MKIYLAWFIIWFWVTLFGAILLGDTSKPFTDALLGALMLEAILSILGFSVWTIIWAVETVRENKHGLK